MKKSLLCCLATALFCTAFAAAGEFVIGYSNMADTDVFIMKRMESFRDVVKQDPTIRTIYSDANADMNKQLDQIDNFLMQGVDMLLVVPVDSEGISSAVRKANRAGVPVLCLGIDAKGGESTFIGSPNHDAGRQQGELMVKMLPQNAQILYLYGLHGNSHSIERWDSFKENCLDKRPDVKLLASQTGDFLRDKGMKITEDWIQAFPKFDAIVSANDQMALGAIQALKVAGRLDGVLISGVDGVEDAVLAVKKGEMTQTILQNAPGQAEAAFKAVQMYRKGEKLPKEIIVPFESITIDNVDQYMK